MTAWPTGEPRPIYPRLKTLTLDVASEVFMAGRGGPEDTDRLNDAFVATVRAASSLVRLPLPGTRWRAGLRGREVLEDYFPRHLPAARQGDGDDLFAGLCHARTPEGEAFTDDRRHQPHDLPDDGGARHLDHRGGGGDLLPGQAPRVAGAGARRVGRLGEGAPGIDDLESLETLDLVVKESLRLVAPVPMLMRRTVADVEIAGRWIPAGTLVALAPAVNHFDAGCWTDPDRFDPERFSDSRREDKNHRFGWIPFGGGVHKCIGLHFGVLEVKAILHQMLRTYTWAVPDGYTARWDNTSLPVPADGLPITLTRR